MELTKFVEDVKKLEDDNGKLTEAIGILKDKNKQQAADYHDQVMVLQSTNDKLRSGFKGIQGAITKILESIPEDTPERKPEDNKE